MAETLIWFPSLFASTKEEEDQPSLALTLPSTPCALNHSTLDLELSLGSIDYDLWKIKKKLTASDVGLWSRLLVPNNLIKCHVLPFLNESLAQRVHSNSGALVTVYDCDENTKHQLVFKYWESSGSYVLQANWIKEIVKVRKLKEGDQIGLYWDARNSMFLFSLLKRADWR